MHALINACTHTHTPPPTHTHTHAVPVGAIVGIVFGLVGALIGICVPIGIWICIFCCIAAQGRQSHQQPIIITRKSHLHSYILSP